MDKIFLSLLNRGIAAGWLILAVLALRLLLKKAPKWLSCVLWGIAAVRLICPFSFESAFSLIPSGETLSRTTVMYAQRPEITSGVSILNRTLNPVIQDAFAPSPGASVNPLQVWMFFGGILWVIGLTVLLLYALASFWHLYVRLRESVPIEENVRLCDGVESPFILGIVHPRIYLPSDLMKEEMKYVLAHERAHLKRRDHWWKLLGYLVAAVYWFHPLVWAAYILFCRDMELACDEKVIKGMDMEGKKAYSHALVTCSVSKRRGMICPVAFGEIGVKERVKAVLGYRKPAFWLILAAIFACAVVAVCFLTNPREDTYKVGITIPAGSEGGIYYSDEEISPYGNRITLWADEGLSDTEVVLMPSGAENEQTAASEYMTPGMPVRMEAEKDVWYRIGVNVSNPAKEDKKVYVRAEGVQIRIASGTEENVSSIPSDLYDLIYPGEGSEVPAETEDAREDTIDAAIQKAILEKNASSYGEMYDLACCDFLPLKTETTEPAGENARNHMVSYYGWALYQEYRISDKGIEDVGGSHIPIVLTFEEKNGNYELKEYWEPREGSYFVTDIRSRFPAEIAEDAIDSQKFGMQQIQSCYRQAVEFSGLDTDRVIGDLLETICSEPGTSSNPQDYVEAHSIEYRELLFYGEYTLRYCLNRFRKGNETGLEGHIMALVCEELMQTKGTIPADAGTAETGQLWYDTLYAHGSNRVESILPE